MEKANTLTVGVLVKEQSSLQMMRQLRRAIRGH